MFQPDFLCGKRVLITGGGSGLGSAMAERFSSLGADLVLVGRRLEALEQTAVALRASGTDVLTRVCDIRDAEGVEALFEELAHTGLPNVLVNNAAASFIAQTELLSHRAADAILGVTLHGAIYCTLAAGRRWIGSGQRGTVLSILSTSTITGRAYTVPSAIAKSGLLAMTKSLAVEWGPKGVRTVAIAPGPFPTDGAEPQLNPGVRAEYQTYTSKNPMGRVGDPEELADLASYLISDRASYINGEMIVMDGGAHLRTSGAEDLLQWTPEQWAQAKSARR